MKRCDFCGRPSEQRVWMRRWPSRPGVRGTVEDVRIRLCAVHLRACVLSGLWVLHEGWRYG